MCTLQAHFWHAHPLTCSLFVALKRYEPKFGVAWNSKANGGKNKCTACTGAIMQTFFYATHPFLVLTCIFRGHGRRPSHLHERCCLYVGPGLHTFFRLKLKCPYLINPRSEWAEILHVTSCEVHGEVSKSPKSLKFTKIINSTPWDLTRACPATSPSHMVLVWSQQILSQNPNPQ